MRVFHSVFYCMSNVDVRFRRNAFENFAKTEYNKYVSVLSYS